MFVEPPSWIAERQVLERPLVDEEAELELFVALFDEELLARGPFRIAGVALGAAHQKIANVELGLDPVHRLEPALERAQHRWHQSAPKATENDGERVTEVRFGAE